MSTKQELSDAVKLADQWRSLAESNAAEMHKNADHAEKWREACGELIDERDALKSQLAQEDRDDIAKHRDAIRREALQECLNLLRDPDKIAMVEIQNLIDACK